MMSTTMQQMVAEQLAKDEIISRYRTEQFLENFGTPEQFLASMSDQKEPTLDGINCAKSRGNE